MGPTAPLDVGFLCPGWAPDVGGVATHASDLAGELARRGHRIAVLSLDGTEGLPPLETRDDVVAGVALRRLAWRYPDQRALADGIQNPGADEAVARWLDDVRPDVVHVHHLTGFGAGAVEVVAAAGIACVVTLHDYWTLCPRGQMLDPRHAACERTDAATCAACLAATWPHLMPSCGGEPRGPDGETLADDAAAVRARARHVRRALGRADRLLTPSAAAREVFRRSGFGLPIRVCENGVAVPPRPSRSDARRGTAFRRLGVLGSVQPSKGVLELARAVVEVPGLVLEVHGPIVPYHGRRAYGDALRELAAKEERIQLRGPYERSRLPAILAGLDAVAAPAVWEEVYGLSVREARAAGLPVLVSDRGGLPEAVVAGGGAVVPAGDHDAWVRALRGFDWEDRPTEPPRSLAAMTDDIEGVYRDALAESARRARAA